MGGNKTCGLYCDDDDGDCQVGQSKGGSSGPAHRTVTETATKTVNGKSTTTTTITKFNKQGVVIQKIVKAQDDSDSESDSDDDPVMTPRRPLMRTQTGSRPLMTSSGRERHTKVPGGPQHETLDTFKRNILDVHNEYRAKHGVPPLVWDDNCASNAQQCAHKCQNNRSLSHSHHPNQGQNAFMAMPAKTGAEATASWYSEIKDYNFNANRGRGTGHFTQVVWKDSQRMGAARSPNGLYIVANYEPAGNFMGQNPNNVFRPR